MSERTEIWSTGGGVQSTAIAALIVQGRLPVPDLAVIIDTERERSTTWDYMDRYSAPALAEIGCTIERVKKSDFATVDLMRGDSILIPAFTTESGEIGKLPTYCSNEWKRRVMQRWAKSKGVTKANVWMGITIDEIQRVKQPLGKWQNKYPLIEMRLTRGDCIALVKRMGWPEPPRSACYMCPNQHFQEWQWQKENSPIDHAAAIEFEKGIQEHDEDMWLTNTGQPVSEVDFTKEDDMFSGWCDSGNCFV